ITRARCEAAGSFVRAARGRWSSTHSLRRGARWWRPSCRPPWLMSEQGGGLVQLGAIRPSVERNRLEYRARMLAWGGIAWHVVEAVRALVSGDHPQVSWVGVGLAAVTALTMPLLAKAKRGVGAGLHSAATVKEARQTQLCAYLSIALLLGLGSNALLGWWWADPLAALVIAGVAVEEGRSSWRGEGCCDDC